MKRRTHKRFHGLYRIDYTVDQNTCYYCGLPADSIDHAPPLSWVYSLGSQYFIDNRMDFLLIPSCRECNHLLGRAKVFGKVNRRNYVKAMLRHKYKKVLVSPSWNIDELDELGINLRGYIQSSDNLKLLTKRRIAYPN